MRSQHAFLLKRPRRPKRDAHDFPSKFQVLVCLATGTDILSLVPQFFASAYVEHCVRWAVTSSFVHKYFIRHVHSMRSVCVCVCVSRDFCLAFFLNHHVHCLEHFPEIVSSLNVPQLFGFFFVYQYWVEFDALHAVKRPTGPISWSAQSSWSARPLGSV